LLSNAEQPGFLGTPSTRIVRSGSTIRVQRDALKQVKRLVVKVGTGVVTDQRKRPDRQQLERLVDQLAVQHRAGREVVLVSSGAVGAGMGALDFDRRPTELAELQACAAVGQSRLMGLYGDLFARHGITVAQVLLIHDDLRHHERHLNARNTLLALLERGVLPIINENDAVSVTELKFGDNDRLAALVACLLPADLLILLTTVDGLIQNFGQADGQIIRRVTTIDRALEQFARGTDSATAIGGMTTKIEAAKITTRAGIPLVIASGRQPTALQAILQGDEEGTLFVPNQRKLRGRKRWIAFFHHPRGSLFVDDGARTALREQGKSLLPPGVLRCEGTFEAGEIVRICDSDGTEFARGQVEYGADSIRAGHLKRVEIIHRDNLVVL
jgi:glutamate 5-kinase